MSFFSSANLQSMSFLKRDCASPSLPTIRYSSSTDPLPDEWWMCRADYLFSTVCWTVKTPERSWHLIFHCLINGKLFCLLNEFTNSCSGPIMFWITEAKSLRTISLALKIFWNFKFKKTLTDLDIIFTCTNFLQNVRLKNIKKIIFNFSDQRLRVGPQFHFDVWLFWRGIIIQFILVWNISILKIYSPLQLDVFKARCLSFKTKTLFGKGLILSIFF